MIDAIITDFDGTLVDTFQANFLAYSESFAAIGLKLTEADYRACFGCRFDDFMHRMGITDSDMQQAIRQAKAEAYPTHFDVLRINRPLLTLIHSMRAQGVKTAIASTARRKNLEGVLQHFHIADDFDLVLAADSSLRPKPAPDIYLEAMRQLNTPASDTLIFEDTDMGLQAAEAAGATAIIRVTNSFFES